MNSHQILCGNRLIDVISAKFLSIEGFWFCKVQKFASFH